MNKKIITFIFSIISLCANSQVFLKLDYYETQIHYNERIQLDEIFNNFQIANYKFDSDLLATQSINLVLELSFIERFEVELVKSNILSDQFRCLILSEQGVLVADPPEVTTWKGQNSRFSIRKNTIIGNFIFNNDEYFVEPISNFISSDISGDHIIYKRQDIIGLELECGIMESITPNLDMLDFMNNGGGIHQNECKKASISIAADGSMVNWLGGVEQTQNRIIDILNWVDGKFQELDIEYQLESIYISISTSTDPWLNTLNASDLLSSFRSWGNSGGFGNDFSVATLWTRRDIQGSGGSNTIGLAYVGTVCNNSRYNLCEHYSSNISGPMILQTHELGHNWSASHTAGQFIMAPTLNLNNTNWDSNSTTNILSHKATRNCLEPCDVTTSIRDTDNPQIVIYPNPSSGLFKIDFNTNQPRVISIYNIVGEILFIKDSFEISNTIQFDHPSGMYVMKIHQVDGSVFSYKLIIN